MRHQMDPESVILQTVFGEPSAASCWFMMNWALLRESGDVSLDTLLEQARAAISAVALKKLLAEFYNRMTECGNDIGSIDVISVLDELSIGEEAVWFLAGQDSGEDPEFSEILNSRDDIHDLLEYFLRREGRAIAQRMLEAFDPSMIFAQMLATAVEVEGLEPEECASPDVYREAVEACFGELNNFSVDYAVCYEWISDGMEL